MNKGLLIDTLIDELVQSGYPYPVGDGEPPKEGGWISGTPNQGRHVPFLVVETGAAIGVSKTMCSTRSKDFRMEIRTTAYAVKRQTSDVVCQGVVDVLDPLMTHLTVGSWKVIHFSVNSLGATVKTSGVNPALWSRTDVWEAYCVPL